MSSVLTWSYDPLASGALAPVYTLRRFMADTDFSSVGPGFPRAQQSALFSDQEYMAFLAENNNDVMFAWSAVLLAIASNRAVMSIYVNMGGGGDVDFRQISGQLIALSQAVLTRYSSIPSENYARVDAGAFSAWRIVQEEILRNM